MLSGHIWKHFSHVSAWKSFLLLFSSFAKTPFFTFTRKMSDPIRRKELWGGLILIPIWPLMLRKGWKATKSSCLHSFKIALTFFAFFRSWLLQQQRVNCQHCASCKKCIEKGAKSCNSHPSNAFSEVLEILRKCLWLWWDFFLCYYMSVPIEGQTNIDNDVRGLCTQN